MPTEQEKDDFKSKLSDIGVETVEENIRLNVYGTKTTWKYQLAEAFVMSQKKNEELNIQRSGLNEARKANKIASRAQWIALAALIISIVVAIFK